MLGGGGVDGAIHRAAGPALLDACRKVKAVNGVRCPYGEARITSAGSLSARYVIHTVGPIYHQSDNPKKVLESAYYQSLLLAKENHCRSVAFPAISCGAYGYPLVDAAHVAFFVCGKNEFSDISIQFYLYGKDIFSLWGNILSHSRSLKEDK